MQFSLEENEGNTVHMKDLKSVQKLHISSCHFILAMKGELSFDRTDYIRKADGKAERNLAGL